MTSGRFITDDGVVVPAITAEKMRQVDRIAIEEETPNLFQMMENAGRSLALAAIDHLGLGWRDVPIAVWAGRGGNGGGGICAARHLANHGGDVVLVLPEPARLSPVTEQQLRVYQKTSGRIDRRGSLKPGLILDALIGYGLKGAPRGLTRELIESMGEAPVPVISLDVPSGLDSTTGETPGVSVEATITLTLALPKTGLAVPAAGELWLADIGIPKQIYTTAGIQVPHPLFDGRYRVHLQRQTS
jgi:NAD(P)H-hydrate epimerase